MTSLMSQPPLTLNYAIITFSSLAGQHTVKALGELNWTLEWGMTILGGRLN